MLVVIPVYGEARVTEALLGDLHQERYLADVVVVDNKGDYEPAGWEEVVRPGENLGWAGGSNRGFEVGRRPEHDAVVWLNNDTRLSPDFLRNLRRTARRTRAAVVSPVYDCHWLHQRVDEAIEASQYHGRRVHREAPFVDGTCMYVPTSTVDRLGLLDAVAFAPLGWGAEIDYCLRVRAAGQAVVVTEAAYLHHERSVTAQAMFDGYDAYLEAAYPAAVAGLEATWGPAWRDLAGIDPTTGQTGRLADLSGRRGRWVSGLLNALRR
jgi:GT2 family glycosyltransferase